MPTALNVLHGNPSFKKATHAETIPPGELLEPPAWMSASQKDIWAYALANAPEGLLRKIDASVLATWVIAQENHAIASQRLSEGGDTLLMRYPGVAMPFASIYLSIIRKEAQVIMRAVDHLGFSPASRARIYADREAALPSSRPSDGVTLQGFLADAPRPPRF
jgi:phage terminase small subunit